MIRNTLKSLTPLVVGMAVGLSIPFSLNVYQNSNVDYFVNDRRVLRKIDGIFSHTEVEVYNNGKIKMTRTSSPYRFYTDNECDGSLDEIYLGGEFLGRGPETEGRFFYRKDHREIYEGTLETNPNVFANAETEFRDQLDRFGLSVQ